MHSKIIFCLIWRGFCYTKWKIESVNFIYLIQQLHMCSIKYENVCNDLIIYAWFVETKSFDKIKSKKH